MATTKTTKTQTSKPKTAAQRVAKSTTAQGKQVDKVDTTLKRDETKVRPAEVEASAAKGGIRLDPNLPLIPGNSVTFVAEYRPGRVQAKIITAKDSWIVAASTFRDDSRVSKILEVPGEITVEFYEDGKEFASGTWTVG